MVLKFVYTASHIKFNTIRENQPAGWPMVYWPEVEQYNQQHVMDILTRPRVEIMTYLCHFYLEDEFFWHMGCMGYTPVLTDGHDLRLQVTPP